MGSLCPKPLQRSTTLIGCSGGTRSTLQVSIELHDANISSDSSTIGVSVTTQRFGVAETSSFTIAGILGVGLGYGFGYPGETEYYYYYEIIDRLFVEGFIRSRAFGLNLGSPSLSEGMQSIRVFTTSA
jgi:hypothetical protein